MRWTSSTPASAARSSTASMTRWRMSGRRIGGSGSEMSSNAIVSFMPGSSSAGSGSLSSGLSSAWRMAPSMSSSGVERLGRVDRPGCGRRAASRGGSPRRGRTGSAASSGRRRGRIRDGASAVRVSFSSRRSKAILTAPRAAGGGGVLDGVAVARRAGRWRDTQPAEVEPRRRASMARSKSSRGVGVAARAAPISRCHSGGEVERDVWPGMPTTQHLAAGGDDLQRLLRASPREPTQSIDHVGTRR